MQFKGLALVASALMFAACGGGSDVAPAGDATPAPAADAAAAPATPAVAGVPATGTVHEVKMLGDDKGYRFEPANLTIKQGDAVKFVALSGFPHNVAFDAGTLSADVKAAINDALGAARMGDLQSNMYMNPNEGFTMSFSNIPPGTYSINCTPHLAMNMRGVITVQ